MKFQNLFFATFSSFLIIFLAVEGCTSQGSQLGIPLPLSRLNNSTYSRVKRSLIDTLTKTTKTDDDMIFSDNIIKKTNIPNIPACKGETFCEDLANYPEEEITNALRKHRSLRLLSFTDEIEIKPRMDMETINTSPLCRSVEQVVYPKLAKSKENEWLFIINQLNFRQGIRIEMCLDNNEECNMFDGLIEGYRTICKQNYIYRQLTAFSEDGSIVRDMFRFPSNCCCHIQFIGNPLIRMGPKLGIQHFAHTVKKKLKL